MTWSDATISELSSEWEAIVAAETIRVTAWPSLIEPVTAEYRSLVAAGRWTIGRDDLIGIIGRHRDELVHSTMLAWLLQPKAPHGLGDRFVRLFVERILGVEDPGTVTQVRCEVQRHDTRADIVVWTDRLTIIIENKVDAGEGIRQCERLYHHFAREQDARFVFLSPGGRTPVTAIGESEGAFTPVSYAQIIELIEETLDETPSTAAGRDVVEGYLRTMRREFGT